MKYLTPPAESCNPGRAGAREFWRGKYREAYRKLRECRNHLLRSTLAYNDGEVAVAAEADRAPAANPELLVVSNPGERFGSVRGKSLIVRHKGGNMRRRRKHGRNSPITVKIGGKRYTWRGFLKKMKKPIKKALRIWRKKKKYHGWSKVRIAANRRRRSRRSRKCNYRRKHRRGRK